MKASGLIWTPEQLKSYLTNPAGSTSIHCVP
jgi:hypothetical protein